MTFKVRRRMGVGNSCPKEKGEKILHSEETVYVNVKLGMKKELKGQFS